jgi:TPR repeat protein
MRAWIPVVVLGMATVAVSAAPQLSAEKFQAIKSAAEKGNIDAQFLVGLQYQVGDGVDRDPQAAASWFRRAAEAGNAEAQNALGQIYAKGGDIEPDPVEARKWLRAAVDQGNTDAAYHLGQVLAAGKPTADDRAEAVKWYERAADAGNVDAMCRLAECYARGLGRGADPVRALEWYRRAAESGSVEARFVLDRRQYLGEQAALATQARETAAPLRESAEVAALLPAGDGAVAGPADTTEDRVRWQTILADLAEPDAWLVRAYLLEHGIGMARDLPEALRYYRRAAAAGRLPAQARLGEWYAAGIGVAQDKVEAWTWLTRAAAGGSTDAAEALEKLAAGMSKEGRATARARYQERFGEPPPG